MTGASSAVLPRWIRADGGAVVLDVLVQPRASRTRVVGEHDGRLKIQVAAPPVNGDANAALRAFLAKALDVRLGDVTLAHGEAGRRKTVRVSGTTAERVRAALSP